MSRDRWRGAMGSVLGCIGAIIVMPFVALFELVADVLRFMAMFGVVGGGIWLMLIPWWIALPVAALITRIVGFSVELVLVIAFGVSVLYWTAKLWAKIFKNTSDDSGCILNSIAGLLLVVMIPALLAMVVPPLTEEMAKAQLVAFGVVLAAAMLATAASVQLREFCCALGDGVR